jgi:hypothetical protein
MTAPPPHDDLPDEVTEAYRRASERDAAGPASHVRAAILTEAARSARPQQSVFAARSFGDWKWKAAAGVAVVGLIGILSSQIFRGSAVRPLERQSDASPVAAAPALARAPAPEARAATQEPLAPPAAVAPPSPKTRRAMQPLTAAEPRSKTSDSNLQEVIVTEQPRGQNLQQVPAASARVGVRTSAAAGLSDASAAVSAHCKQNSTLTPVIDCDRIGVELQLQVREVRDSNWAARAEDQLRSAVAGNIVTRDFTVRALECRTQFCVLEIAGPAQVDTTTSIASRLSFGNEPVVVYREPELAWVDTDASGNPTLIEVAVFVRR